MRLSLDPVASHRPSRPTIITAAVVTAGVLGALVVLAAVAPRAVPLLPYYDINAQFRNAENLRDLAEVSIAGRDVGDVSSITYSRGIVTVELQMFPGTQRLTSDATARIRLKNPIGARYVEITPSANGTTLNSDATLPVSRTSTAVDTQTLLSGFTAQTRSNLTRSLVGLGQGLLGRGTGINEELPVAGPELANLDAVAATINSTPRAASDFAPSADALVSAYDPVRAELADGFDPESQVLQDIGDERGNLQRTLDISTGALRALQAGLAMSDPLLRQLSGLAHATIDLTGPAPAALEATTVLLHTGVPSLRRSLPLLRAVDGAVAPTLHLLDTAYPVLSPTDATLTQQLAPLTTLVAHNCDFLNETENWRSAMSFGVPGNYDPTSHLSSLEPGLGPDINSFRVLALAPTTSETLDADAPGAFAHGTDAYPAPCAANGEALK